MVDRCLLDTEQPHIHGFLCGHIVISPYAADQVLMVSHPLEQTILANVWYAILLDDFSQLTNEDITMAHAHTVGEHDHGFSVLPAA